jgi:hypothetical protein
MYNCILIALPRYNRYHGYINTIRLTFNGVVKCCNGASPVMIRIQVPYTIIKVTTHFTQMCCVLINFQNVGDSQSINRIVFYKHHWSNILVSFLVIGDGYVGVQAVKDTGDAVLELSVAGSYLRENANAYSSRSIPRWIVTESTITTYIWLNQLVGVTGSRLVDVTEFITRLMLST